MTGKDDKMREDLDRLLRAEISHLDFAADGERLFDKISQVQETQQDSPSDPVRKLMAYKTGASDFFAGAIAGIKDLVGGLPPLAEPALRGGTSTSGDTADTEAEQSGREKEEHWYISYFEPLNGRNHLILSAPSFAEHMADPVIEILLDQREIATTIEREKDDIYISYDGPAPEHYEITAMGDGTYLIDLYSEKNPD